MFDIRKIQEQVIYKAVEDECGEERAKEIVYGSNGKKPLKLSKKG